MLSDADRTAAHAWIAEALAVEPADLDVSVVRERGWGDIWQATPRTGPAAGLLHWFKAPHPSLAREVGLRRVLDARCPDEILPLVAADASRGWQLSADAGPTLAALSRTEDIAFLLPLPDDGPAPGYVALARALARVQRGVSAADLAGLGMPEFRPADAVRTMAERLEVFAALPVGHPVHCRPEEKARAADQMRAVVGAWEELVGEHPELDLLSVEHNDLHAGNAFLVDGRVRISDWGDAVLGHPFASLRALLFPARNVFGEDAVTAIRAAYLEEFFAGGEAPPQQVQQRALDLAMTLGAANRLQCWTVMPEAVWREYAEYIVPLWREAGRPFAEVSMA
ncbi:phosphotransferase family protein [Micrococcus sp. FDAARGOS_333]|uniref:phosphotransferase family protein n=1 Tax=Micrococcus sp. FDAARGOS_333 TaxID=1930558 RepID=UPI000B4E47B0|nr:phosphotransferase [Micrococcus sp. FDAARGOS_333]PNL16788.1 hypothetical protein CEQ11_000155 [Micrococcus sp. FDAARGOS_333]